ncbi:DUF1129 family protein [Jeotgalibacillus campisalis]|uniref:DUF1129 family protein n=1 Tax=Jeotgalibacillus campisalis TaxID=220754 RepID=A0A0C2W9B6_9BACL|nr:DUF1129 family protein [Jeotgalibacillus campisalis]KIL53181.1 hypothetical protein KR50_05100 [Jeotgalibacillus campisalis]
MTTTAFIELNNKRRKELTPQNEAFYKNILLYVRGSNVDQRAGEELLLELLEHLIDAQARGKKAVDVFGLHPEEYCKKLVDALPKASIKQKAILSGSVLSFSGMWLFGLLSAAQLLWPELQPSIAVSHLAAVVMVMLLLPGTILTLLKKSLFTAEQSRIENVIWVITMGFIWLIPIAIIYIVPATFKIEGSFFLYGSVFAVLLLVHFVLEKLK